MSLEETPPEKGRGRRARVHWRTMKTARGETHEAHACGHAKWYDCHTRYGVTQPCLQVVTKGELKCARCGEEIETMGYVAVWRARDTQPMVALVHLDQRERCDKLRRGQPVWVMRDDHKTAGIAVIGRTDDHKKFLKLDSPALLAPIDLSEYCLAVWKLPQLKDWFRAKKEASDNAVSLTKTEVPAALKQRLSVPPPTTTVEALAIDAHKDGGYDLGNVDWEKVELERLQREQNAMKNGKHKKEDG